MRHRKSASVFCVFVLLYSLGAGLGLADIPITVPTLSETEPAATNDFDKMNFARTVVAPSVRNIPSYSIYVHQYREFARKNPLAHKALYFSLQGDHENAVKTREVLEGRRSAREWAKYTPDLGAKLDLFRFKAGVERNGPLGSKASASVSTGASLSATLDGENAVLGYLDAREEEEDREQLLRILADPQEIDDVAGVLATLDLNNQGAIQNGGEPFYGADNTPFTALRDALSQILGPVPVFLPKIEDQLETLSAEDAEKFRSHEVLKRLLDLSEEERDRFSNYLTPAEERIEILGYSEEEFSKVISDALWPKQKDLSDQTVGAHELESVLSGYVPQNEIAYQSYLKSLEDIEIRIIEAQTRKGNSSDAEEIRSLDQNIGFLESERREVEKQLKIERFEDSLEEYQAEIQGIAAVIGLVDAEFAHGINQYVQGVGNVLMGGYRLYSGDVSFAAVGQMAQGIQTLTQRRGTSFEEIADKKLDAILDNQRAIFEGLKNIDMRLTLLAEQIEQLRGIVLAQNRIVQDDLRNVIHRLDRFERNFARALRVVGAAELEELRDRIEDDYLEFMMTISDGWEIGRRNNFHTYYANGQEGETPELAVVFNNSRRLLASAILEDSLNHPLVRRAGSLKEIEDYNSLQNALAIPISYRTAYIHSIWEHLAFDRLEPIPNIEFLTQYSRAYLNLISHLPRMKTPDQNLSGICHANFKTIETMNTIADQSELALTQILERIQSRRDRALMTISEGFSDLHLSLLLRSYGNDFAESPGLKLADWSNKRAKAYNHWPRVDLGSPAYGYFTNDLLLPSIEQFTASKAASFAQKTRKEVYAYNQGINELLQRTDLMRYLLKNSEDLESFSIDYQVFLIEKLKDLNWDELANLLVRMRIVEARFLTGDRLEQLRQQQIFQDSSQSPSVRQNAKKLMQAALNRERANKNKLFNMYVSLSPSLLQGGLTHEFNIVKSEVAKLFGSPVVTQFPGKHGNRPYDAQIGGRGLLKQGRNTGLGTYSITTEKFMPDAQAKRVLIDGRRILSALLVLDIRKAQSAKGWRDLYFSEKNLQITVVELYRDLFSLASLLELTFGDCADLRPEIFDRLDDLLDTASTKILDIEHRISRPQSISDPTAFVGELVTALNEISVKTTSIRDLANFSESKFCMASTYGWDDLADRFELLGEFRSDLSGQRVCPVVKSLETTILN